MKHRGTKWLVVAATLFTLGASSQHNSFQTNIIRHQYAPGEITTLCTEAISQTRTELDAIAVQKSLRGFIDFEDQMAEFSDRVNSLTFMGYVSPDADLRTEAFKCEEAVSSFSVEIMTRKDLYQRVLFSHAAGSEEERLHSQLVKSFEENGLQLSDEKLAELRALKKELGQLESKFSKNLNEDATTVSFSEAELAGTSQDFKNRLKKDGDGQYIVTTKRTDYGHVMENATNPETRRQMQFAYNNRAAATNTKLLEEAVVLRFKIGQLLGFENWADARTSGRMAQNSTNVRNLLTDLKAKLAAKTKEDLDALLVEKKRVEDPNATELHSWDISFFSNLLKKSQFSLDSETVREYFPSDVVVKGMFQVYSKLLDVGYQEVKGANVWHPSVKLYAVTENNTGAVLAYFFGDFFPREGKYGHAAAFTLVSGRRFSKGNYNVPVSSIVANFTPPTANKPSLLSHDEVETLFHEFGHIMHQILTRAPYASLSGSSVARDFVEAPSQMLEEWVWDKDILNMISGHYTDHSQKLPEELLEKMLAAKNFNRAYFYSRQLTFGLTDLEIHSATGPVDVTEAFDRNYEQTIGVKPIQGGHFMAGFGHMMGGYDAGYYGYIWSEVYAADMFTAFESAGLLDETTGHRYRQFILEQGNMDDPLNLVTKFLGRTPNNQAFFKKLGITQ